VLEIDLLTVLLVVGVVVLIVSTTVMTLTTAPARRERRDRRVRRERREGAASGALSPSAQHAIALARARAAANSTEAASASVPPLLIPAGQIIDISDGPVRDRERARKMTVEDAQALAEHIAETDPQFVAEVISQWIRADSSGPVVRP
jgi:hypothetical protein